MRLDGVILNKKAKLLLGFVRGGLSGSDGLGTLTDRAVFTWKSKQYRFVFPKVLVA
jgi:hypothetical protein